MRQNIVAAAVVLCLGLAAYHVMTELAASSRILACIESGHRNCGQSPVAGNGHR